MHLSYWIGSDDVGGLKVLAKGNMFYLIEWSASSGEEYLFAERDTEDFLARILKLKGGKI